MNKFVSLAASSVLFSVSALATPLVGDDLTISSSVSTPLINLNNLGISGAATTLLDHDPTALDPDAGHFYFNTGTFPGINAPASARADTVWTFGYNVAPGGGRVDPSEPTLALHFEDYFIQGGAIGQPEVVEFHLESVDTSGGVHRPFGAYLNRDGTDGQLAYAGSLHRFYDYSETQRVLFDFTNPAVNSISFVQPTTLYYNANNSMIGLQINAAGTSWLPLPYMDGTNGLVIGQPVHTPTGVLRIIGMASPDSLCIEGHTFSCVAKGDGGGGYVGGYNATYTSGVGVTRVQTGPMSAIYTRNSGSIAIIAGGSAAPGTTGTEMFQVSPSGTILNGLGNVATAPLDVNGNTIRLRAANTFGATCNVGDIGWDATPRIGVCVATNTWRFSALTP